MQSHVESFEPAKLSSAEYKKLGSDLLAIHNRIYERVPQDGEEDSQVATDQYEAMVVRTLLGKGTEYTTVDLYRDADTKEIIGYCAYHIHKKTIAEEEITVIKAEAGKLREYRGNSSTFLKGCLLAMQYKIMHPFTKVYLFEMLISPASFHLLQKYLKVWPRADKPLPEDIETFMIALGDAFGVPRVNDDPMIRNFGLRAIETAEDQINWKKRCSNDSDIKYFLEHNPTYEQGHGLATLVPVDYSNLPALFYYAYDKLLSAAGLRVKPQFATEAKVEAADEGSSSSIVDDRDVSSVTTTCYSSPIGLRHRRGFKLAEEEVTVQASKSYSCQ